MVFFTESCLRRPRERLSVSVMGTCFTDMRRGRSQGWLDKSSGLKVIPIPLASALRALQRGREGEGVIIMKDCYRISSREARRRLNELAKGRDHRALTV
jgi:hypothetical protein